MTDPSGMCSESSGDFNMFAQTDNVDIFLGYTETPVGLSNHSYVIASNSSGSFATRAGPSYGYDNGSGIGLGGIHAVADNWDESFQDSPSVTHTYQFVGNISNTTLNNVSEQMTNFANVTNSNHIAYAGVTGNSNSYAFTFVESLGFDRPEPIVSAWGSSVGRPDSDLSY